MQFSTTISAVIVNLLATILPLLGIQIGTDQLTTTIQVIIALATGLWIWFQRTKLQAAPGGFGDVRGSGRRK